MSPKVRLSASVDAELVAAAEAAVAAGRSGSVSAWVNAALQLKREDDQRLASLRAFVAAYEAKHGEITQEEIQAARRRAHSRALIVRPVSPTRRSAPSKGRTRP